MREGIGRAVREVLRRKNPDVAALIRSSVATEIAGIGIERLPRSRSARQSVSSPIFWKTPAVAYGTT